MRRVLIVVGLLLVAAGLFDAVAGTRWTVATKTWAVDYEINFVAAQRLVDRQPLYDAAAARREAVRTIRPEMRLTGRDPFSSYIGSPAVALSQVPFLPFGHETGAQWFRFVSFLGMVLSVFLTAWALAPPARLPAALIGLGVLLWTFPMVKALALGQGTGMVMFSLALGIWGAARERWGVAGIGLGLASVLKVSPVLLVVYLVLRGHRRVLWSALATAAGTLGLAAVIGRPGDLWVWLRDVSPSVSKGTLSTYNQSMVGAISRLTTPHADLSLRIGPGGWYLLAYVCWAAALGGLWWRCRGRRLDPLELGLLIIVLVVAGPLTWDHYFAWLALPVVLVADPARWRSRRPVEVAALGIALGSAAILCRKGIPLPSPDAVRADWWMRVATDRYAAASVLLLAVTTWLLVRAPDPAPGRTEWADDPGDAESRNRRAVVGDPLGLVATGVHRRG